MNEASPQKRRGRAFKRMAAATATVFGAALLTTPGTATAQTDIDCDALGDNPIADSPDDALATATTCGVEVRIGYRAEAHTTISVTPEGQFHVAATVAGTQDAGANGPVDPTLEVRGDSLLFANGYAAARLPYSDTAEFILITGAAELDWKSALPLPEYSGNTAVYDEIAAGLDLTAVSGTAATGLVFTAADESAWNSLATGLSLGGGMDPYSDDVFSASGGALRVDNPDYPYYRSAQSTPFTVRDADGDTTVAEIGLAEDGSVSVGLPEGALESAAFPLTVSTQWIPRSFMTPEWGAVTSADADLPIFRGDAGLGEPYFQAAGETANAVAGTYCDALVAPDCASPAEAALYWNFQWTYVNEFLPGWNVTDLPVTSAVFQVDAADGSSCAAPQLSLTEPYEPGATWSDRPAATGTAGVGACQDGTAVYDLTETAAAAWDDHESAQLLTLGITEPAETARFDGDSARLDVYFDAVDFRYLEGVICGRSAENPRFQAADPAKYADFYVDTWGAGLIDLGITWTAEIRNTDTGETVWTEPTSIATGPQPPSTMDLEDGRYQIDYEFRSSTVDFAFDSATCHTVIDRSVPEIVDIAIEPGPHHIDDTVAVDLTLADEHFPNGWNTLTVGCVGGSQCENPQQVEVNDDGTVRFQVRLPKAVNKPRFYIYDGAGNEIYSDTVVIPATNSLNDYNGDGHQDLIAVRKSDGALMFHAGKGDGAFKSAVSIGTGWGKMDIAMVGDVTGDGVPDLFARDTSTGTVYTYKGNGAGGVGSRIVSGTGWQDIGAIGTGGELFASTGLDVLAVDRSDGNLYYYPYAGDGSGKFVNRILAGSGGWNAVDNLTGLGDVDNDGFGDFLAHNSRTGEYHVYYYLEPYGTIAYGRRTALGTSLGESLERRYDRVVNVGDLNGDGYNDLLGTDSRSGELLSFSYGENAALVRPGNVIGTGWGGTRLPTGTLDQPYDYNGDGRTDVLARRGSDGKVYFYSGNGAGGFGPIGSWGTNLQSLSLIETAGDLNGDGFADVIGRVGSTGELYLFPGNGDGTYDYDARVRISTGWNSMSAIMSGHDYNGDGTIDVIAREKSTGYLWLYAGKGDGTIGSRVQIGTGWNALRDITAAGDLDHDGHADVIAIRGSDNCMYFYGGRSNGTLKPGVQVGCNWVGYDSVASVGDFDGDGHADWIARRASDGAVYLYKGDGAGGYSSRAQIATGWTWANAIA